MKTIFYKKKIKKNILFLFVKNEDIPNTIRLLLELKLLQEMVILQKYTSYKIYNF